MYLKAFNVFFSLFALLLGITYLMVITLHLFLQQFPLVSQLWDILVLFIATLFPSFVGCWIVSFLIELVLMGTKAIM